MAREACVGVLGVARVAREDGLGVVGPRAAQHEPFRLDALRLPLTHGRLAVPGAWLPRGEFKTRPAGACDLAPRPLDHLKRARVPRLRQPQQHPVVRAVVVGEEKAVGSAWSSTSRSENLGPHGHGFRHPRGPAMSFRRTKSAGVEQLVPSSTPGSRTASWQSRSQLVPRRVSEPFDLARALAARGAGVHRGLRLEQQHVSLVVGYRPVLGAVRDDDELALVSRPALPELHAQTALEHEEQLVFDVVRVPDELPRSFTS